ncbi:MAG: hypothetical protein ABI467_02635 [Kofleriaceae bacterium]
MMRGLVRSLIVVGLLGGMAFAGDPMPVEQAADPKPADSKFETVKKDPPTEGVPAKHAVKHKHKHKQARRAHKAHRAHKAGHKKAHHKAKSKAK